MEDAGFAEVLALTYVDYDFITRLDEKYQAIITHRYRPAFKFFNAYWGQLFKCIMQVVIWADNTNDDCKIKLLYGDDEVTGVEELFTYLIEIYGIWCNLILDE